VGDAVGGVACECGVVSPEQVSYLVRRDRLDITRGREYPRDSAVRVGPRERVPWARLHPLPRWIDAQDREGARLREWIHDASADTDHTAQCGVPALDSVAHGCRVRAERLVNADSALSFRRCSGAVRAGGERGAAECKTRRQQ
jgi:hypothetical protein